MRKIKPVLLCHVLCAAVMLNFAGSRAHAAVPEVSHTPTLPSDVALEEGLTVEFTKSDVEKLIPWAKSTRENLRETLELIEKTEVRPDRQVEKLITAFQSIVKSSSPQANELFFRYLMNRGLKLVEIDLSQSKLTAKGSSGMDHARRAEFLKSIGAKALTYLESELKWLGDLGKEEKENPKIDLSKRDRAKFGIEAFDIALHYTRQIINAKAQVKDLYVAMLLLREDLFDKAKQEYTQAFARETLNLTAVLEAVGNPDAWLEDSDNEECQSTYRTLLATALQVHQQDVKIYQNLEAARENSRPVSVSTAGSNVLNMQFVRISAGTFMMGSPSSEAGRFENESQHEVKITKSFEIQTTEVTQLQWFSLVGNNPSKFKTKENCPSEVIEKNGVSMCPNNPVEQVSWEDAQDFIRMLNQKNDGYTYRLPTEAEWEYAARAGSQTAYYTYGSETNQLGNYAWYDDNSGRQTHPSASKKANAWDLYDMYGNVSEWVQDWYGHEAVTDPTGSPTGAYRVLRGGGCADDARHLRSAFRNGVYPSFRYLIVGFRLVRTR